MNYHAIHGNCFAVGGNYHVSHGNCTSNDVIELQMMVVPVIPMVITTLKAVILPERTSAVFAFACTYIHMSAEVNFLPFPLSDCVSLPTF
jgi:hypothetical protein